MLSLGRYHLAPGTDVGALQRRYSGGRAVPAGEGFVGVALVLPHRSALAGSAPFALAPEQVINRCVRGVLDGLQRLGVAVHYPGRDVVTAGGRILALASFEVDAAGALLFEAVIAANRDFSLLPALLDVVDPAGVVKADLLSPADTTSVARELGREVATADVLAALRAGYEARLGVALAERVLDPPAVDARAWLTQRRPRPDLDRRGWVRGQLGTVEVHCALDGGRLGEVLVAGDFIADSPAVARLERELRGCAAERSAVAAVVERAFAPPASFVLGVAPRAITDAIATAAGAGA